MKKESFYFSHDANAHIDDKILELRAEYDWEGYGVFWVLIEILRSQTDYTYNLSKISGLSIAIAKPKQWLTDYINYCIKLGLFIENDGEFYSESLMNRMEQIDEKRKKRAEAGRLGGIAKAKAKQSSSNAKAKPSKEKKIKESKEKEKLKIYTVCQEFIKLWNDIEGIQKRSFVSDSVKAKVFSKIEARFKTFKEDGFNQFFTNIKDSSHVFNEKWFTIDFCIKNDENFQKVIDRWMDWKKNDKPKSGGYCLASL